MKNTFFEKKQKIIDLFNQCSNEEDKYNLIIHLGRQQEKLPLEHRIEEKLVKGCQSDMYLHSWKADNLIHFSAYSEALISMGLAALLIQVYSAEEPEVILTQSPDYLDTIGLKNALTPTRANGLHSMLLRMKQEALKTITRR